jgi:hypothetical protein
VDRAHAGAYVRLRIRGNGAGLGLTIVSRVARKANAAVIVDSAAGKWGDGGPVLPAGGRSGGANASA